MTLNYTDIGNRIKAQRIRSAITQENLAEMAAISVQHLSGIENGKTKFSVGSIVRIANALELSLDELLCGSLVVGKTMVANEITELLDTCSPQEAMMILDIVKALKQSLKTKRDDEA